MKKITDQTPTTIKTDDAAAKAQDLCLAILNTNKPDKPFLSVQDITGNPCDCYRCIREFDDSEKGQERMRTHFFPLVAQRFIICSVCGNKRCPKATDHRLACTGSNEPGQKGSRYA